jgi:endonuclease YncB( thermonuclease family)
VFNPNDPIGKQAKEYTTKMLLDKEADFEIIHRGPKLLFAVVCQGETCINEELVRQGLAVVDPKFKNTPYGITLISLQRNARKKKVGMWGKKNGNFSLKAQGGARQDKQSVIIKPKKPLITF